MARNEAYFRAEEAIEEARRSQATELDLSGRHSTEKLTELPESLGQVTQLQVLYLENNQLTALPESLGQLTRLESLFLDNNQLTALPESLGQLSRLATLNLKNNQLTALPESLSRLTRLHTLFLESNQLTTLPESLGQLSRLTYLDLESNQLTALPKSLGQLSQLAALYVSDNELAELPETLVHLYQLKVFTLDRNPLNPELAAAYSEGLDAVKRYLRAKAEAQVVLNEAKLILVGEGEVGKSCLLGALRGDPWDGGRLTTHGIEIKSVKVSDPASGTEITLNGWDFGGVSAHSSVVLQFPCCLSGGLETTRRSTARIREGVDQTGEAPRARCQDPGRGHPRRPQRTTARY
jgi:Leucine-rich repeat (LRR) protein